MSTLRGGTIRVTTRAYGDAYVRSNLIPSDPHLLKALGRLVIARTHLELTLRYTVKALAGPIFQKLQDAAMISHYDRRLGMSDARIEPFKGMVTWKVTNLRAAFYS